MTNKSIKSALESLLFVWGEPLEAKTAAELFNLSVSDMLHIMRELADDYKDIPLAAELGVAFIMTKEKEIKIGRNM